MEKAGITHEDGERRAADYRAFLDRIGADVVGVCEYAEDFTTNGSLKASAAVFDLSDHDAVSCTLTLRR